MKKSLMIVALVLGLTVSINTQASVGDRLLLYLPNRIVDMVDIFSVSLGVGPVIRAEVHFTRVIALGAGIGGTVKAIKGINRQYGAGLEEGWDAHFLMISAESKEFSETVGTAKGFYDYETGVPSMDDELYNFYNGVRDFWSIGVDAGAMAEVSFEFHPVELADFITGWLFIDLKGDDFTGDELRN